MKARAISLVVASCLFGGLFLPSKAEDRPAVDLVTLNKELDKHKKQRQSLSDLLADGRRHDKDPNAVFVEGTITYFFRGNIPMSRRDISYVITKTELWKASHLAWYDRFQRMLGGHSEPSDTFRTPDDLYNYLLAESEQIRKERREGLPGIESEIGKLTTRIRRLEEQKAALLEEPVEVYYVPPPELATCADVAGTWGHNTEKIGCTSTWSLVKTGSNEYEAVESGCGRATGSANVSGRRLSIEFTCADGCAGIYVVDLDKTCKAGSGYVSFMPTGHPVCNGQRTTPKFWLKPQR